MTYDVAIIGGGIVGLATAYRMSQRFPDRSLVILEKEGAVATHQTGRNSGVIHSGIYYEPGSLKAENCREGRRALVDFCEREGVAFDVCGKVIVAVEEAELPRLEAIHARGEQNHIRCERIGPERLRELEPHTAGVAAIHVPDAGIVDYVGFSRRLAALVQDRGHDVVTGAEVAGMQHHADALVLETARGPYHAHFVVNCGGLHADRLARMSGQDPAVRIIPFRGEYFELKPSARHLCRNLIYPVPDPAFPFLGVHFTRMIDGRVECGPSAVLAFAREGYTFATFSGRDVADYLRFKGFRHMAMRYWKTGLKEMWQSLSKAYYLKKLQRLVPEITASDLEYSPSGVRAQAVRPDGTMVQDFLIDETPRVVNVVNAASPAATASLNVGNVIVDRLGTRFA